MMYGNYDRGEYGNDMYGRRMRDSRGRYMTGGRGRGNYRGEEMLEEMKEHYGNYTESKEEMMRGNYGAEGITDKAFDYMLKSAKDFFMFLMEDADKPEQMEKIRMTAREISEMR